MSLEPRLEAVRPEHKEVVVVDTSVTWPTMPEGRRASGARHEVAPGELFFSMTDQRGVITAANSVFVKMARFSREDLIGAPHSIIRHHDMPAGCFKLMWDELLAGRPFCAYVNNLASDGSTYTVFATIAPAADGFLSVRTRPLRTDLLGAAVGLYEVVRPLELAAREQGVNRRDAATLGLNELAKLLAGTPFGVYGEFQWAALVSETQARAAQAEDPHSVRPTTGPLAAMEACCHNLAAELHGWSDHYTAIIRLVHLLAQAITDLLGAAGAVAQTATSLGTADNAANPLVARLNETGVLIDRLVDQLRAFRQTCCYASTWAALAEIHTEVLSQFVRELGADEPAPSDGAAVHQLCHALVRDFVEVAERAERTAEAAMALVPELDRTLTVMFGQPTASAGDPGANSHPSDAWAQMEESLGVVARLGHEIAAVSTPQDTSTAEMQVIQLLTLMAQLTR